MRSAIVNTLWIQSSTSVDKDGIVHAMRAGNAVLIGEYAGVNDKVRVTVESR
jgi:carbonic anhydrase/acetyltransferase-like protein (isoleucine patch superfamily)